MRAINWSYGNLRLEYDTEQIAKVYHHDRYIGKVWLNASQLWTTETVNGDNCGTSFLCAFYAADQMRLFLRLP